MHRQRVHGSQGWAAFDRKQRARDGTGDEGDVDPFPPILGATSSDPASSLIMSNNRTKTKSFSSVVRPSMKFAGGHNNCNGKSLVDNKVKLNYHVNSATKADATVKLLKDVHGWADDNLIEDILAGMDNDVDEASALLKAMALDNLETGDASAPSQFASKNNKEKCSTENCAIDNKVPNGAHKLPMPMNIASIPLEPEWEEDDIYLSHRKDAIKMMRAASQHSQSASNAFLRGDHVAARQHSLRAQEEWIAAEKLNSKAAEEILRLRNINNDIWKIDLHGLHASEAVSALEKHLRKIECQLVTDRSASSGELSKHESGMVRSPSVESIAGSNVESLSWKLAFARPRQAVLHVITGSGKHSKGEASLPAAIRSFLIENGYRFDEARPGVLAVRPKFRHR